MKKGRNMSKKTVFETTRTTTDAIQFNFYERDKGKALNSQLKIFTIIMALLIIFLFCGLIAKIPFIQYGIQVVVMVFLIAGAYFIPKIIKDTKLKARGAPYYEIGVDFNNSELLMKTGASGMYAYDTKRIDSLSVVEISEEASMWTIDKKTGYKVAHEMVSPLTGSLQGDIEKIRDNRFIIKLIALLLLNKKNVSVMGPHWNLQNMLVQDDKSAFSNDEYKESINVYKKNETIGGGYYLNAIILSFIVIGLSYFFQAYILMGFASLIVWYYVYKYLSNPGFLNKIEILKKDSLLNGELKESVKRNSPDIAYILTVPMKVISPYEKHYAKKMEKVLIMGKGNALFVRTASGKNLLE